MNFGIISRSIVLLFVVAISAPAQSVAPSNAGWTADPKLLKELEKRHVPWLYREEDVPPYQLPDPLLCADGSRVNNVEQWEKQRRPETLDLFRKFVYGRPPADPVRTIFEVIATDPKALDGRATRKQVKITSADSEGKSFTFEAAVLIPNGIDHPGPAFLLINNRAVENADPSRQQKDAFWPAEEIIGRGYATAVFRTNDVDPDRKEAAARAQGVRGVWPAGAGKVGEDAWGTIAAWAWGASRVLDYLQSDRAIDPAKVAIIGHSRGGKTALWAAAQDPRFAIAFSNDSGCGGAAIKRRKFGETFKAINHGFPYWFCENFKVFDDHEERLPVDQHQLLALIAPRPVYVASADADFWADQRGEFLALANAAPVYALYGLDGFKPDEMPPLQKPAIRGRVGYHIRPGPHDLTVYDWECFLNFADHVWGHR